MFVGVLNGGLVGGGGGVSLLEANALRRDPNIILLGVRLRPLPSKSGDRAGDRVIRVDVGEELVMLNCLAIVFQYGRR